MASERFKVTVFSPYETFYEGLAVSLSGQNRTGPFDILFNHGNFFSILPAGLVAINTGFDTVRVEVSSGILKVSNNQVVLFANV